MENHVVLKVTIYFCLITIDDSCNELPMLHLNVFLIAGDENVTFSHHETVGNVLFWHALGNYKKI